MVLGSSRHTQSKNMVSRTQLMKTWCKSDERTTFPRQKCPVGPLKTVCSGPLSHILAGPYSPTPLHRVVNPKVTFAQKTQLILSFVTEIRSPIGFLKSFTVGKYPYQHAKTVKTTLCNVKCKMKHFKFRL